MWLEFIVNDSGFSVSVSITSVISGMLFHVAQEVFFPQPRSCDVVSQPLKAWKRGRALDLVGPNMDVKSWIGISL